MVPPHTREIIWARSLLLCQGRKGVLRNYRPCSEFRSIRAIAAVSWASYFQASIPMCKTLPGPMTPPCTLLELGTEGSY